MRDSRADDHPIGKVGITKRGSLEFGTGLEGARVHFLRRISNFVEGMVGRANRVHAGTLWATKAALASATHLREVTLLKKHGGRDESVVEVDEHGPLGELRRSDRTGHVTTQLGGRVAYGEEPILPDLLS